MTERDGKFAQRIYEGLQAKGLRVFYAPEKLKGGEYLHDQLDRAIQLHDRLLLILSEARLESEWVKREIRKALEKEAREQRRVLFPLTLIDVEKIKQREWFDGKLGKDLIEEICKYFIPDFRNWKNHDSHTKAFDRLLRDLKEHTG